MPRNTSQWCQFRCRKLGDDKILPVAWETKYANRYTLFPFCVHLYLLHFRQRTKSKLINTFTLQNKINILTIRLTVWSLYAKDTSRSFMQFNYTGKSSRDTHYSFCGYIRNRIVNLSWENKTNLISTKRTVPSVRSLLQLYQLSDKRSKASVFVWKKKAHKNVTVVCLLGS
jgi:hypothetical protein